MNVTKTFLPPQNEYNNILKRAWDNGWLTNRGELVLELEQKLKSFLGVEHIIAVANGTLPIQIALNFLGNRGEIITTPFSYVATTSSIVWENCKPVFVDIHPDYLTIDEQKIEDAITENTTAILATHVFGNPCATDAIQKIAEKHHLKVIYDAAHAFGVTYRGISLLSYGDISTCSFHATKIFHTGEGGCITTNNTDMRDVLLQKCNFGHITSETFNHVGINAKMSELSAAMGLAVFPYFNVILAQRKRVVEFYDELLDFSKIKKVKLRDNTEWNYSYYPLIFNTESQLLKSIKELKRNNIYPRRYFFPSLNTLPYVDNVACPTSEDVSNRVLCLPLYVGLENNAIITISNIINKIIQNNE
ncbi:DegT/DnrJ/EryC1/StrS family aminotransferase [Dokdonia sinensis]|uniref:DegT/DnrJ/EryC1/StrS family aminotransferase n=1 Tax=Dokdonia sinensis TaxID=2479847 RepID=A0A3M0FXL7_9FLAO|nr:DegT/DnrJ/EryC1/StrS family aminotransferase [Dokdonia sinensis]RMB57441.1 DegT/DnrJ/EryC1/StrS family aminotransferase [Dokdonia sinensis]